MTLKEYLNEGCLNEDTIPYLPKNFLPLNKLLKHIEGYEKNIQETEKKLQKGKNYPKENNPDYIKTLEDNLIAFKKTLKYLKGE